MATLAQLTEAVSTINTALAAVGEEITSLNAAIANAITSADSDALLAQLNTIAVTLAGMIPQVVPTTPDTQG